MPRTSDALLKEEEVRLAALTANLPPQLRASVARHQEQLTALVENLVAVGMDEERINEAVTRLIHAYKTELLSALRNIGET